MSIVMLDVDNFKAYNDTYGHLAGDHRLIWIANALKDATRREGDLAARHGGEELVAVLPNTESDGARTIAESIRRSVASLAIPHAGTRVEARDVVTISAGVATLIPHEGMTAETLIQLADEALYRAKRAGRDRVETHESGPTGPAQ